MPSTFTSNLGIELPADGELDGLWGDIVNENMGILDRAVNGSLNLTLAGTSSTLTTSDGALSNGQYKMLVLGGSPSGTHTITIAPNDAQKIYYVRNTTAQSVVFTQGSGGNVTIASGDTAIISSDGGGSGAAVFNINNDFGFSSVTITGGTMNGVAIGGSSAAAGAFTTVSASGDVSIADKIVHTGDTNTSIRFPASDTVTIETSGAEQFRVNASGFVGIGRTSPGARLDVNGDALINGMTLGTGGLTRTTFLGQTAGGLGAADNTALGYQALKASTSLSNDNTAVGSTALQAMTSGDNNTAVGSVSGYNLTTGANNTAIGFQSMVLNETAAGNTAVGSRAMYSATTQSNTAVGYESMLLTTTGSLNQAFGVQSLYNNIGGNRNCALGYIALWTNTSGSQNNGIGNYGLYHCTTGSGNIGFGGLTAANALSPVFTVTTQDNRVVMGHTAVTNAYIQVAWTVVSDSRDKRDIQDLDKGLDFVNQLQPKSYKFKTSREDDTPNGRERYGFLAQDILELEGSNPVIIDDEDPDRLKYCGESLVPVLVKAVQELSARLSAAEAEIAKIKRSES